MVADVLLHTPPDIAVGEIEVRPAVLGNRPVTGIARLQSV
jgi:hypothetical protein